MWQPRCDQSKYRFQFRSVRVRNAAHRRPIYLSVPVPPATPNRLLFFFVDILRGSSFCQRLHRLSRAPDRDGFQHRASDVRALRDGKGGWAPGLPLGRGHRRGGCMERRRRVSATKTANKTIYVMSLLQVFLISIHPAVMFISPKSACIPRPAPAPPDANKPPAIPC